MTLIMNSGGDDEYASKCAICYYTSGAIAERAFIWVCMSGPASLTRTQEFRVLEAQSVRLSTSPTTSNGMGGCLVA